MGETEKEALSTEHQASTNTQATLSKHVVMATRSVEQGCRRMRKVEDEARRLRKTAGGWRRLSGARWAAQERTDE